MEEQTDIVLIGAGPSGVEMAVGLKRAGYRYVQIEAGQVGATMAWWPGGTRWFSSNDRIAIAGVPLVTANQEKATREEYLAYLRGVVLQFDLPIRLYERVVRVERVPCPAQGPGLNAGGGAGFVVVSERRGVERRTGARRVILSTGGTARARRLGIAGEEMGHVSHYLRDPHAYFRQRLLVIGGRNGAVEAALRCHHAGAAVSVSYRREAIEEKHIKYWLWPEFEGLVKAGKIGLHLGTVAEEIAAERVVLRRGDGGKVEVAADFVLVQAGYEADMSLFAGLGVELVGAQGVPRFDAGTMETNVPGAYVCGTATAGTQERYRVFLENCHVHVERILAALGGGRSGAGEAAYGRAET